MSIVERETGAGQEAAGTVPPFRLERPQRIDAPLLIASPHSGHHYPENLLKNLRVPLLDLRRTEDAFVDQLVARAPALGATLLTATHSRAYLDLNRDPRELDPDMFDGEPPGPVAPATARVQAGLGCLPKIGAAGDSIYAKKLSTDDGRTRLEGIHVPYHQALKQEIAALHQQFGSAILLDVHSMPSRQPGRRSLPDIVLGDRFGSSCASQLTSLAERTCRKLGMSVTRNAPYAGGYTTRLYGRPKRHVHALQIEVNRSLYMDEASVELLPAADGLKEKLEILIEEVCALAIRLRP